MTNVLDTVEPPPPDGVLVQVTRSVADQIVVENTTPADLEVLDEAGRPFLRIGPRGVEGDVASAEWARSNSPGGGAVLPETALADAPPSWIQVSTEPSWGWFDHRLHRVALTTAPRVVPGSSVELERWEIPMRLGGRPLVARGRRLFSRPAGRFRHEITSSIDGIEAAVLDGAVPAIFLRAEASAPELVLFGTDGEPFARIGTRGAEVNQASPTWSLTERSRSGLVPDGPIGWGTAPRWRQENTAPHLTWLEPRAIPRSEGDDVAWSIPGRLGAEPVAIQGRSVWIPAASQTRSSGRAWFVAGLSAGAVLLAGVSVAIWRRRRRVPPAAQKSDG